MPCFGMLDRVRERLLDDTEDRGRDVGRYLLVAEAGGEVDDDAGLRAPRLEQPLDRRDEPEVVERLGMKVDGELPHVAEGGEREIVKPGDRLVRHPGVGLALEAA
jgi:hypothetical protein